MFPPLIQLHYQDVATLQLGFGPQSSKPNSTVLTLDFSFPAQTFFGERGEKVSASSSSQSTAPPPVHVEQSFVTIGNDIPQISLASTCDGTDLCTRFPDETRRNQFIQFLMCIWAIVHLSRRGQIGPFTDIFRNENASTYWGCVAYAELVQPLIQEVFAASDVMRTMVDGSILKLLEHTLALGSAMAEFLSSHLEYLEEDGAYAAAQLQIREARATLTMRQLHIVSADDLAILTGLRARIAELESQIEMQQSAAAQKETTHPSRTSPSSQTDLSDLASIRGLVYNHMESVAAQLEQQRLQFKSQMDALIRERQQAWSDAILQSEYDKQIHRRMRRN